MGSSICNVMMPRTVILFTLDSSSLLSLTSVYPLMKEEPTVFSYRQTFWTTVVEKQFYMRANGSLSLVMCMNVHYV